MMSTTSHISRRAALVLLQAVAVGLTLSALAPGRAHAQVITSDPTNLVQNTSSALAEAQQTVGQFKQLANDTKMLLNQARMLKELDIRDLNSVLEALGQIRAIALHTLRLSHQWARFAGDFKRNYGMCGPPSIFSDGTYPSLKDRLSSELDQLQREWSCATDTASQQHLSSLAQAAESSSRLATQADQFQDKAQSVQGVRDAGQLNAHINATALNQRALLLDMQLKRAHAEETARAERRARRRAARARQREVLGRHFDTQARAEPVALPDF